MFQAKAAGISIWWEERTFGEKGVHPPRAARTTSRMKILLRKWHDDACIDPIIHIRTGKAISRSQPGAA
jgi:hypothetical protein